MSEALEEAKDTHMRRFRTYPEYKDSGIKWLGEIPAHWEKRRLKNSASIRNIKIDEKPEEFVYLGLEHIESWTGRLLLDNQPDNVESGVSVFKNGDVLFGKLRPYLAKVARPDFEGVCTSELIVINTALHDQDFLYYALLNSSFITWINSQTYGTKMPRVSPDRIEVAFLQLPPKKEQRAIADFLGRETAKIDELVEKKERLIELLREKRTALITRAVTKGLDPNVPMKDSGVEWLGEIPAHWGVKPLKHIAKFVNGFAFKPEEWGLEGTPIIRIENLNGGGKFNYTMRELPSKYRADKDDLLFGWSGNRGTSFGPFLWWRSGRHYVNQHIFRIVDFDVDKLWLHWVLRGVTFYIEKQAHGIIGMVHITRGELGSIAMPVLPDHEQQQIAQYLQQEYVQLDTIDAQIREAIDLLKEYRTALISAAVTGKIDVRKEVA